MGNRHDRLRPPSHVPAELTPALSVMAWIDPATYPATAPPPSRGPMTDAPTPPPAPDDEAILRLAEAMVFSNAAPVTPRALSRILPEGVDPDAVIEALRARYANRGVELAEV